MAATVGFIGENTRLMQDAKAVRTEMLRIFEERGANPRLMKIVKDLADASAEDIVHVGLTIRQRYVYDDVRKLVILDLKEKSRVSEKGYREFRREHGWFFATWAKLSGWPTWRAIRRFNEIVRQL